MSDHGTAIEWTQAPGFKGETWNPVTGCDRVSPGCANCYALELAARLKGMGQNRYQRDGDPKTSGPGFGLTLHPDKLEDPLRWRKPRMVFVNSMSDLFHEEIPDEYIIEVFNVMAKADRHVFQVLTKRPERMQQLLAGAAECEHGWLTHNGDNPSSCGGTGLVLGDHHGWPLPNVWLGTSIENRRFVDRADLLRQTPAAVRFISAEPLLGPLVPMPLTRLISERTDLDESDCIPDPRPSRTAYAWGDGYAGEALDLTDIDWLIVGGESGPKHRRIDPHWVRDLRDVAIATWSQCCACAGPYPDTCDGCRLDRGTAFFFKQWGGTTAKAGGRELDGRTWDEFPETS